MKNRYYKYIVLYNGIRGRAGYIFTLKRAVGSKQIQELGRELTKAFGFEWFHYSNIVSNYENH